MIRLFVNGTDRSSRLDDGSLVIADQIQNKANTCNLTMMPGSYSAPEENQEVLAFDAVRLVSASGTAVVLYDDLASGISIMDRGKFRAGQYFWLGIGAAGEERVIISEIEEGSSGQVNVTLSSAMLNAHSANEWCGKKIFAGSITSVRKANPRLLSDVEYQVSCTDHTKAFDRKLINDSWEDRDARYVVNDILDTTINYNRELDDMDYADDAAVQAEWIEGNDGTNPTRYATSYIQGTSAVSLDWTYSSGTASFAATPASADLSDLTKAASGSPTEGNVTFWYKRKSATGISSVAVRLGSDSSNYSTQAFVPESDTEWHFKSLALAISTEVGTPAWTAADYLAFLVSETTSSGIIIDDVRITADGSFTMYGFEETTEFDDIRASFRKPTVFLERMAKTLSKYWYVDYDRDIHFFDRETNDAPFSITATSDNYDKLVIDVDTSQLKNRQTVRGGTETSASYYTQTVAGDAAVREWILKSQFVSLTVFLDDNTSTDTMEATTTSTTVVATAHGLANGDYVVNRSRSNAVRKITLVDANSFTVEAVTSQASGDTFSKFATAQTVGVENLVDETTVNYVSNYNEKSIRAGSATATLPATSFLLFKYQEVIPVRVQVQDSASIASLKALLGGDGIFDGAAITDQSLDSSTAARDRARAEVEQWANPVVKVTFATDHEGIESGQLIRVTDSNRSIDDDYVVQSVKSSYSGDFPRMSVTCASSLFGLIEYFQRISNALSELNVDENEVIDQLANESVGITVTESNATGATEEADESATISVTPTSDAATERNVSTSPYLWEPDASDSRWDLAQYG